MQFYLSLVFSFVILWSFQLSFSIELFKLDGVVMILEL